jgi:hypothetical protein
VEKQYMECAGEPALYISEACLGNRAEQAPLNKAAASCRTPKRLPNIPTFHYSNALRVVATFGHEEDRHYRKPEAAARRGYL